MEVKPCRCKPKSASALSDEDQEMYKKDNDFLELIATGDLAGVETMIKGGQEVNVGNEQGESSCHKAAKLTEIAMLKTLIKHGAHADYSDSYGNRPINIAMQMGEDCLEHVNYLLSLKDTKGGPAVNLQLANFKTGNTLLHDAAWIGNTEACEALLKTGGFKDLIEAHNKQGQTAMHVAAFRAPKSLVSALVDAGANSTAPEKNGRRISKETPEMMAQAMGREDTANYLRDLNTAVNAVKFGARMKMGAKKSNEEVEQPVGSSA